MAVRLSDDLKKYIDESRVFATVATVLPDGRPHLTVVWLDRDGDDLVYSTTVARQQAKNLAKDPRVTVMINPTFNPLSKEDADRVIVRVTPEKVTGRL